MSSTRSSTHTHPACLAPENIEYTVYCINVNAPTRSAHRHVRLHTCLSIHYKAASSQDLYRRQRHWYFKPRSANFHKSNVQSKSLSNNLQITVPLFSLRLAILVDQITLNDPANKSHDLDYCRVCKHKLIANKK